MPAADLLYYNTDNITEISNMASRRERNTISLLARGAVQRALLACIPISIIWMIVAWALR